MRTLVVVLMAGLLNIGSSDAKAGQKLGQGDTVMRPPGPEYFQGLPDGYAQEAARYKQLLQAGKITQKRYGDWSMDFMDRIAQEKKQQQNMQQLDNLPDPYSGM